MATQMMNHEAAGAAIKARRELLGLSREALGAAAGGVSCSTIRRVEREEVRSHPSTLAALTRALDAVDANAPSDQLGASLENSGWQARHEDQV
jgi:transcriptional regulator with XRE-family HTH domain